MTHDHRKQDALDVLPKQTTLLFIIFVLLVALSVLMMWCFGRQPVGPKGHAERPESSPPPQTEAAIELPPAHGRLKTQGFAFQLRKFQVEEGNEAAARKYYKERVSPQTSFLTPDKIETSTITDLLEYFGYGSLAPADLHRLPSDELMKLSPAGEILATRFFAPKITGVSAKPTEIPGGGFGWRKLVRFSAKSDSKAAQNGIGMLFLLQNIFEETAAGNPFNADKNVSKFNQAIVTRKDGPFSPAKEPAYFFAYSQLVKIDGDGRPVKDASGNFQSEGRISFSLKATFDEGARDPETGLNPRDYYVPDSCLECHGKSRLRAKLNYLDTDHWIDRVVPNYGLSDASFKEEDFTALQNSPYDLIFDGEKNPEKFQRAFDVIRLLNEEIRDQNQAVGGPNNFQLNAVLRWLELHQVGKFGPKHAPPYERGFGNRLWDPSNDEHRKVVYYLNRYCYRCHSSVNYNVFDREAVEGRIPTIYGRVVDIVDAESWMPQDRIFPGLVVNQISGEATANGRLKEFLALLAQLQP